MAPLSDKKKNGDDERREQSFSVHRRQRWRYQDNSRENKHEN